jgi:hypothetical protein
MNFQYYSEKVFPLGTVTTNQSIFPSLATVWTMTLGATPIGITFNNVGLTSGLAYSINIIITQPAGGNALVTWPASVKWNGGVAPSLSTAGNAMDAFVLFTLDAGTTWYGSLAGKGFA